MIEFENLKMRRYVTGNTEKWKCLLRSSRNGGNGQIELICRRMETEKQDPGNEALNRFREKLRQRNMGLRDLLTVLITHPSMWVVLATNLVVFVLPGFGMDQAITLVWIYWTQSVMIGIVHACKMLFYRFREDDSATGVFNTKIGTAIFFLFHYGFFHLVYVFFIGTENVNWQLLQEAAGIMLGGILVNSVLHYRNENSGDWKLGAFMMRPYLRIIPMHIAIILGGIAGGPGIFVFLIVFKTILDLGSEYFSIRKLDLAIEIQETSSKTSASDS